MAFVNRTGRSCLDRVEERDIDLLLLEELTCEPDMQRLMASLTISDAANAIFLESSNSVSPVSGGESDLILLYAVFNKTVAVMMENKIGASFMPEQADRYHRRGSLGVEQGLWDEYVTCLVAPRRYLESDHGPHVFQKYIAYEDLLPHFEREGGGAHAAWRAALVRQACDLSRQSYVRMPDDDATSFYRTYFEIAQSEFADLRMPIEKDRTAGNTWVSFRPNVGFPKKTYLWHKGMMGVVDLSVSDCTSERLHLALLGNLPPEMAVESSGKSAVVRIQVPKLSITLDAASQMNEIRVALRAARRLTEFFAGHRDAFLSTQVRKAGA